RLLVPALTVQGDAEVAVRSGGVGPEADGLPVGRLRLLVPALHAQGDAEVEVRLGVVVLEADGLLEVCLRLLWPVQVVPEGVAPMDITPRVALPLRAEALEERQALPPPPGPQSRPSEGHSPLRPQGPHRHKALRRLTPTLLPRQQVPQRVVQPDLPR